MQLVHKNCQLAPGPRHGAPFGCSVTRPYEITHPSRAFRAVLDCQLVKFIGFFHICMVLLRATRRGPSRDRRTRMIQSVKKQRFRSPCAGPKCVLMTSMHQRHCCPIYEGSPARVYGYAWCLMAHGRRDAQKRVSDLLYGEVHVKSKFGKLCQVQNYDKIL